MREVNFQIEEVGLMYIAHFRAVVLKVYTHDFGIEIPFDRLNDFTALFPDINWEDGYFLHKLKGRYMRYVECDGKVIQFKHIIKDITYYVNNDLRENA